MTDVSLFCFLMASVTFLAFFINACPAECLSAWQVPAPFKPDCGTAPSDSSNFAKFSDEDIVVGSTNEYASLFADF